MKIHAHVAVALIGAISLLPATAAAQAAAKAPATAFKAPDRAIRRDIPLTNMIRRAFAAGTRDSSGKPGRNYWQVWNDYTIHAKFDAAARVVSGTETIVVHNDGPNPMSSIQMRLDQNLFAANVPKAEKVTDITDGMQLSRLVVNGQVVDLNPPPAGRGGGGRGRGGAGGAPTATTISGADVTSAKITLMTPVAPHTTATIEASWSFRVPRSDPPTRGIRMGSWGDSLFQVGQWYPRVAVFDDLRQGGWDTDPYLGPSEFYNNLGHFDYTIDAPSGWLIGATGLLQNPQDVLTADERQRLSHVLESDSQQVILAPDHFGPGKATAAGDRLVWHFVADSVADVAWAISRSFEWDATRANIPGKGYIPINLMFLPGHQNFKQQGATGRHALEFYSKLWMPYTFPLLTQVDGPENGMEYPMFIMAAGSTDHEIGHQWWPMMVNTNETWYGFMDEGFNNWMNTLSAADRAASGGGGRGRGAGGGGRGGAALCSFVAFPAATQDSLFRACLTGGRGGAAPATAADTARAEALGIALGGRGGGGGGRGGGPCTPYMTYPAPGGTATENCSGQRYGAQYSGNETEAPLMWDANYGGPGYSSQAYNISGPMLSMLGGIVGDSAVWHAMSDYAKAWRFKHPSPWDYAFYMSNALHKDLGWFWYYWLFTTESVDASIAGMTTAAAGSTVTVHQDGQMPSPVVLAVQFAGKGPAIRKMANSTMINDSTAVVTYPVDVWFNGSKTFKAVLNFGGRKIEKVTLDPYGRFPDRDVTDNVWPRDTTAAGGRGTAGGRRGRGGE